MDKLVELMAINDPKDLMGKYSGYPDIYNENILDWIKKNDSEFPITLITKIFEKKQNEKILYFEGEKFYVAKITNIVMPNETNDSEKNISLSSNLKNAFGSEIIKSKKISTNDGLLNALLSQY